MGINSEDFGRDVMQLAPTELPLQLPGAEVNHYRSTVGTGVGGGCLLQLPHQFSHLFVG